MSDNIGIIDIFHVFHGDPDLTHVGIVPVDDDDIAFLQIMSPVFPDLFTLQFPAGIVGTQIQQP